MNEKKSGGGQSMIDRPCIIIKVQMRVLDFIDLVLLLGQVRCASTRAASHSTGCQGSYFSSYNQNSDSWIRC